MRVRLGWPRGSEKRELEHECERVWRRLASQTWYRLCRLCRRRPSTVGVLGETRSATPLSIHRWLAPPTLQLYTSRGKVRSTRRLRVSSRGRRLLGTSMFRNQYDSDVTIWSPQGRLHQASFPLGPVILSWIQDLCLTSPYWLQNHIFS